MVSKNTQKENKEVKYKSKSITLLESQYEDIVSIAAYNKLTRSGPSSVSEIIRDALDQYLAAVGDDYKKAIKKAKRVKTTI